MEQIQFHKNGQWTLTKSEPKLIGKTESGKAVYDKFSHPAHDSFTKQDHLNAANLHHGLGTKGDLGQAMHHMKAAGIGGKIPQPIPKKAA